MTSAAVRCSSRNSVPAAHRRVAACPARSTRACSAACSASQGARHRIGAGHVAGVTADLAAGVDQHELACAQRPGRRREVQHPGVGTAGHDRVEGEEVGAVAEELRLELDLKLALGAPGPEQRHDRCEPGRGGPLGRPHAIELDRVLLTADVIQFAPELGGQLGAGADPGYRGAEGRESPPRARCEPTVQVGDRGHALARGVRARPLPEELLGRDRSDEIDPPLLRVEGENPARPLAVGQVEVLRVGSERIRPIGPSGHGNRLAGADEHRLRAQVPALGDGSPSALDLSGELGLQ